MHCQQCEYSTRMGVTYTLVVVVSPHQYKGCSSHFIMKCDVPTKLGGTTGTKLSNHSFYSDNSYVCLRIARTAYSTHTPHRNPINFLLR